MAHRSDKQVAEIPPFEILSLNQLDLPVTLPFLELLLACDGFFSPFIGFHIYKALNTICLDEC